MISVTCRFKGCDCGCTPPQAVRISAQNQEDLNKAVVEWALGYLMIENKPEGGDLDKLDIPQESRALLDEMIEVMMESAKTYIEIQETEELLKDYFRAEKLLEVVMPEKARLAVEELQGKDKVLREKIDGLEERMFVLQDHDDVEIDYLADISGKVSLPN